MGINDKNRHAMARHWKDPQYLLSFLFSHFLFSSIGAANIHRITWANMKRAGGDGINHQATARRMFDESFCSFLRWFTWRPWLTSRFSATIFPRSWANRANINRAGQESRSLRSWVYAMYLWRWPSSFYLSRAFSCLFILPSWLTLLARGRTSREAGGGEVQIGKRRGFFVHMTDSPN